MSGVLDSDETLNLVKLSALTFDRKTFGLETFFKVNFVIHKFSLQPLNIISSFLHKLGLRTSGESLIGQKTLGFETIGLYLLAFFGTVGILFDSF